MAEATPYEDMRDKIRALYNLGISDIDNTLMELLFTAIMKIYSRSCGLRAYTKLDLGTNPYTLAAEVFDIQYALWNDCYPSNLTDAQYTIEQYHNPTLKILEHIKERIYEELQIVDDYDFQPYRDGTDKKIIFDPEPTTPIYVVYRKLHTKITYPLEDEELIEYLFKADILQHCRSTGLIVTIGDITYDNRGMDNKIRDLRNKYYSRIQTVAIGRS